MPKVWKVLNKDGTEGEVAGQVLTHGPKKGAVAILGIASEGKYYGLYHIPSRTYIAKGFIYQVQAKVVGRELLDRVGDILRSDSPAFISKSFPPLLLEYMKHYRGSADKEVKSFQGWLDDRFNADSDGASGVTGSNNSLPLPPKTQYSEELQERSLSLGYVPTTTGAFTGHELRSLLRDFFGPYKDMDGGVI